jgi:hypothetical protein
VRQVYTYRPDCESKGLLAFAGLFTIQPNFDLVENESFSQGLIALTYRRTRRKAKKKS